MRMPLPDVEKILTGPKTFPLIIFKNLVFVLIVFFIFSLAEGKFEVVAFSILLILVLYQFSLQGLLVKGNWANNLYLAKLVRNLLIELLDSTR